jgi:hypothetical protein
MIILASKLFESDFSHSILHMLQPSLAHVQLLFEENADIEHLVVTDCVEPMFQADLKRIETEKKFKTHIRGAFFVQRDTVASLLASASPHTAASWTELLGPLADS